jgi:small subunit ribosomal protein S17
MQTEKQVAHQPRRGQTRTMIGSVLRLSSAKTVVVEVVTSKKHALYQKTLRRKKRYLAHDERGECQVGDVVELMSTRPLSKLKRWRVSRIVQKAV